MPEHETAVNEIPLLLVPGPGAKPVPVPAPSATRLVAARPLPPSPVMPSPSIGGGFSGLGPPPPLFVPGRAGEGPRGVPVAASVQLTQAPPPRELPDDPTVDMAPVLAPQPPALVYPRGMVASGPPEGAFPDTAPPGTGGAGSEPVSGALRRGARGPEVEALQRMLNQAGTFPLLQTDGEMGRLTERALRAYQATHGLRPDGVFGPATRAALEGGVSEVAPHPVTGGARPHPEVAPKPAPHPSAGEPRPTESAPQQGTGGPRVELISDGDFCFPIAFRPVADWHTGARYFGARRANGRRKHAGCDILGPIGTTIYAVADGTLVRPAYRFYEHVDAVEIRHHGFVIRYGEILPGSYIGAKTVKRGQPICKIGRLDSGNSMLHFEMYANGESTGSLTDRRRPPFQRRADLTDPTKYLDAWVKKLPR